jgi:hypothetical protein
MKNLIVITSNEYIRNYFETSAFGLLEQNEYFFCALDTVSYRAPLEKLPNFIGYFSVSNEAIKKNTLLFNIMMLRHQKRSITFKFRYKRQFLNLKNIYENKLQELTQPSKTSKLLKQTLPLRLSEFISLCLYSPSSAITFTKQAINFGLIYLLGRPVLDQVSKYFFEKTTLPSTSLEEIIQNMRPGLVMLPTQAIDTVGNDILRLKKKYNYKTFFLIDNWDNLSSKSIFVYPPDYLAVWGQQSLEHAKTIHKIESKKVFKIGTPRFEPYYALEKSMAEGDYPRSPYSFSYILFVGCSIAFDETTALEKIDSALIEYNSHHKNPIKLIYRPHPWREARKKETIFLKENFKYVELDDQVAENYYSAKGGNFQPNLDYYPALLGNALFVIGPLTTMLLESSLLKKKVLALAYDDHIHYTSPHNALKYYKHFEGIEKIPGFHFSYSIDELKENVNHILNTLNNPIDSDAHKKSIEYFLYRDSKTYSERLNNILNELKLIQ